MFTFIYMKHKPMYFLICVSQYTLSSIATYEMQNLKILRQNIIFHCHFHFISIILSALFHCHFHFIFIILLALFQCHFHFISIILSALFHCHFHFISIILSTIFHCHFHFISIILSALFDKNRPTLNGEKI